MACTTLPMRLTAVAPIEVASSAAPVHEVVLTGSDADFTKREQASSELEALGDAAKEALLAAARSPDVEIASRAALTGHLVFSTLHTNDAPSAFTRLIDMGIEPFLVASSVEAVMA